MNKDLIISFVAVLVLIGGFLGILKYGFTSNEPIHNSYTPTDNCQSWDYQCIQAHARRNPNPPVSERERRLEYLRTHPGSLPYGNTYYDSSSSSSSSNEPMHYIPNNDRTAVVIVFHY